LAEAEMLAALSREAQQDRATFLKQMLRRGVASYRRERACDAYRLGEASLSRAAELAGVSLYDMLVLLAAQNTSLNYDAQALAADFAEVAER
jgi:predicted HTH domain antitoxin